MKYCSACGMPLEKTEDFAQGNLESEFCLHCVNEDGSVKTCGEIFAGGVQFFMGVIPGAEKSFAEKIVCKHMNTLSYWQGNNCECLKGEQATDEEFRVVMEKM